MEPRVNGLRRYRVKLDLSHLVDILLFILCIHKILAESKGCAESLATLNIVPKCPQDYESWKTAAERKHCEGIAKIQRCSEPKKFVYHCLINNWENATVEVCAPAWFINGFCAEFNIPEGKILNHLQRDCTSSPIPCPARYISSEAYKYPGCYFMKSLKPRTSCCSYKKNITQIDLAEERGRGSKCTDCRNIYKPALIVLAVISAILLIILVLLAIVHKRSEKSLSQQPQGIKETKTEEGIQPMHISSAYNTVRTNQSSDVYQTLLKEGRPLTIRNTCDWHCQNTSRESTYTEHSFSSALMPKLGHDLRCAKNVEQFRRLKKYGNPKENGRFTVQIYKDVFEDE